MMCGAAVWFLHDSTKVGARPDCVSSMTSVSGRRVGALHTLRSRRLWRDRCEHVSPADDRCEQEDVTQQFPMYVMLVQHFLSMLEAQPHQVLKSQGLLRDFDTLLETVSVFVSHQWCSSRHPDPRMRQLRVLQGVFRKAMEGALQVKLDMFATFVYRLKVSVCARDFKGVQSWTMWYDYFSVPQPEAPMAESTQHGDLTADLGKAVASLPVYVQKCTHFFILAPFVRHEDGRLIDYTSWKGRGSSWARLWGVCSAACARDVR